MTGSRRSSTHRNRIAARWVAVPLTAVAAWIGGCSGHDDPGTPRSTGPATSGSGGAASSARRTSPLDELLGQISDPTELSEAFAEFTAGYPAEMTRCMRERGFPEFTEEMPPTPTAEDLGAVAPSLSTLSEHGYGVSENLRLQIDNSLEDHGSEEMPAWRAELSPSQQSALLADEVACQKLALDKFPHPLVLNTSTDAYEQIQAAKRSIEGGPEITAIWTEWSRCMQGRGYTAPRRDDLVKELNGPADAVIAELEAAQRQATGRLPADSPAIAAARRDAAAIAAREAEVVADDLACAEPMHLEERLREAQLRLEGEYLDDHGDELRQMLAAASSRQAAG